MPIEILSAYAREDEALLADVHRQLEFFNRRNIIRMWHDRLIPPGSQWQGQIDDRLNRSDLILLFASPHFLASDYCVAEMTGAMSRYDRGDGRVIPTIARPCMWQGTPLAHLDVLPKDGKPITSWSDRDEACLNVAQGIMRVVARPKD